MLSSYWFKKEKTEIQSDITIVGGGYIGLSLAYWLTEMRPYLKIIVVERSFCGSGASGRNAGFLTVGSASFYKSVNSKWGNEKSLKLRKFGQESLDLVFSEILKSSSDISFNKTSSMTLLQSADQYQKLLNDQFNPNQFDFEFIENKKLSYHLKERFFGALESGIEYKIDPSELIANLKRKIESRGVKILENQSVFNITSEGIESSLCWIKAKQVVLALDGYFSQFHSTFHGKIFSRRAQMMAVQLGETFSCPHLYYDSPERVYWRMTDDRTLLIGGKRVLDEANEVGEFEKISSKVQIGLETYLKDQLNLKKFKVIKRWSGIMGFTEHELPFSELITAPIETFIIGGFSGHGMGFGFGAAKNLAEYVCGHSQSTFFSQFKKEEFIL